MELRFEALPLRSEFESQGHVSSTKGGDMAMSDMTISVKVSAEIDEESFDRVRKQLGALKDKEPTAFVGAIAGIAAGANAAVGTKISRRKLLRFWR